MQITSPTVTPNRHDATASFAATAQENDDDAGDDFPLPDASRHDVLPYTIPRRHGIPVPLRQ